ncbi:hypothetical protein ERO13_A09G240950v2 [Gossypium hirsutum]|uniref:Uncharacterized protein n=2 Tax=Gossypium TaxID=3633 RepID=A0A5D2P8A4_GOSTO|nr:hypothetical protein ERO13_A09G240950v2 [Gossypium hirsutum]TYH04229.1 hypothetical protein ES288_A09G282200v1 [Gossypium darwinii]TYI12458.1 hypothetical protein ES332_A09G279300v1 [Gossypium tomentosum]
MEEVSKFQLRDPNMVGSRWFYKAWLNCFGSHLCKQIRTLKT